MTARCCKITACRIFYPHFSIIAPVTRMVYYWCRRCGLLLRLWWLFPSSILRCLFIPFSCALYRMTVVIVSQQELICILIYTVGNNRLHVQWVRFFINDPRTGFLVQSFPLSNAIIYSAATGTVVISAIVVASKTDMFPFHMHQFIFMKWNLADI